MTDQQLSALREAQAAAEEAQHAIGCPAAVLAAIWALESGYGRGASACGIKCRPDAPGARLLATKEWFTDAEAAAFEATGQGREIIERTMTVDGNGRHLYRVRDWFAFDASIAAAIQRLAKLITNGRYGAAFRAYQASDKGLAAIGDYARAINAAGYSTTVDWPERVLREMAAIEEATA